MVQGTLREKRYLLKPYNSFGRSLELAALRACVPVPIALLQERHELLAIAALVLQPLAVHGVRDEDLSAWFALA